jgi:hypothetical protein
MGIPINESLYPDKQLEIKVGPFGGEILTLI